MITEEEEDVLRVCGRLCGVGGVMRMCSSTLPLSSGAVFPRAGGEDSVGHCLSRRLRGPQTELVHS